VAATQAGKSQLRIGRLTKAHGLKGGIKVEMFTDDPDGRFTPGAVFTLQVPDSSAWHNKTIELIELKWYNSHAVAFFKDVPDRSVAETLIKAILWIDHDLAEIPEEEDAWFDHQLLGLSVIRDGSKVGIVTAIDHFPAQDLLTVKTDTGDVLVPFVKAIVTAVDVKAGTMTVTPPVGLFEDLPDDEQPGAEKLVEYIEPDAAVTPASGEPDESTPAAPSES
jgi:16S rRNA processing protein RimM